MEDNIDITSNSALSKLKLIHLNKLIEKYEQRLGCLNSDLLYNWDYQRKVIEKRNRGTGLRAPEEASITTRKKHFIGAPMLSYIFAIGLFSYASLPSIVYISLPLHRRIFLAALIAITHSVIGVNYLKKEYSFQVTPLYYDSIHISS